MRNEKENYGEVGTTTGFYMALNEGERVDLARSSPQEVRICSPGKRSATGEDSGASGRKTPKQKAQSSDGAFRLRCYGSGFSRRRCCAPFPGYGLVAPVSAAPPGELYATQQKTPHLPVRGSSYLMPG
ncbi:MAG: hypothetical protein KH967_05035, partial [Klebsiella aerogenes]|nr:hypothetical protein [Klebsiella aerogenes]